MFKHLQFFILILSITLSNASFAEKSFGNYKLELVSKGLSRPVGIESSEDATGRLFIVEQGGKIKIITAEGHLLTKPFLNLKNVLPSGEQLVAHYETGLLGLVFHPDYETNGRFFVFYTDKQFAVVVKEYKVSDTDPNVANPHAVKTIIRTPHPTYFNHFGGQMEFGPDGFLYIGFADGGGIGDPFDTAASPKTLKGKIIRIDINNTDGKRYGIPSDNPFANKSGYRPEIWAIGFRNPWRFSFDPATGRLFVGDVGQHRVEEVDLVEKGKNYGWNVMEGPICFSPVGVELPDCDKDGLEKPIYQYYHNFNHVTYTTTAIVGGFVYHGSKIPELENKYLFSDFTKGRIWALKEKLDGTWRKENIFANLNFVLTTFGQDDEGEIYVAAFSKGSIYKIVPLE